MDQVLQGGIRSALDAAGYNHSPATPDELIICFLDYVDAGYWSNLDLEQAWEEIQEEEIKLMDMIQALRGA